MKVAVLITGQLRDYKINVQNHIKQIIEPNDADVFVYATDRNTLHTTGPNITQKYVITTSQSRRQITRETKKIYGSYLKKVVVADEDLADDDFGTIGYFRKRMQNQMNNIREGFKMCSEYAKRNSFEYDIVVRCRPDNSMFKHRMDLSVFDVKENQVYATQFYTGHRDPWFFAFATPKTFDTYCSLVYLEGVDDTRTDNNFVCPERAMEDYLIGQGVQLLYVTDACLPFYGYDKNKITDFPFRQEEEQLIAPDGSLVSPGLK